MTHNNIVFFFDGDTTLDEGGLGPGRILPPGQEEEEDDMEREYGDQMEDDIELLARGGKEKFI